MSKLEKGLSKQHIRTKKPDLSPLLYGKMPPQAPDLEGAVLGAIMIEPQCLDEVMDIIGDSEVFYSDANQRIYEAMKRMYQRGARIDFMTVSEELRKSSELEMVGGSYYVTGLTRDVVSSAHIEEHCRIVMQKYAMRDLIRFCGETLSIAYEDATDVFEIIDQVSDYSSQITDKMIKKQFQHISTPINRLIASTTEKVHADVKMFGVSTGFRELNFITGGWQKTDLIILAARPAIGKTAFALQLLLGAVGIDSNELRISDTITLLLEVIQSGKAKPAAFFSLEMSTEQLLQRMACNICDLDYKQLKDGTITLQELDYFTKVCQLLSKLPIYFDDNASLNSTTLRAKVRKLKRKHDIGFIIVDYIQLMEGDEGKGNREQEISKVSRDLKKLAKDVEIPIMALSQMSRAVESRSSNTPQLSDLRESGAIEQDADVVMFLYGHPEKYIKSNPYKAHERNLGIRKHRAGKCADLMYDFIGDRQRFTRESLTIIDVDHEVVRENKVTVVPSATFEQIKAAEDFKPKTDLFDELPF